MNMLMYYVCNSQFGQVMAEKATKWKKTAEIVSMVTSSTQVGVVVSSPCVVNVIR